MPGIFFHPEPLARMSSVLPCAVLTSGCKDSNLILLAPDQARLPLHHIPLLLVGLTGFEPMTPSPPVRCAEPNCATARFLTTLPALFEDQDSSPCRHRASAGA